MVLRVRCDRLSAGLVTAIPFAAVLVLLGPYLWPPGTAPTSYFSDIHHQHGPNIKLIHDALTTDGELPRWNVQDFAGTPTVTDPQVGLYNPVYWLLLLHPTLGAFGLLIVAYALVGSAGFILYARAVGLSLAAAAAGAVIFTIGGKLLLHLMLPGHSVKAPFYLLPLILWLVDRTVRRPRADRAAALAVLTALLAVSLHPQILLYSTCLLVVAGAAAARHAPRPRRAFAALALAAALSVALAAVHILPFVALSGEFSRAHRELWDVIRWNVQNPGARAHWSELLTGASQSWEGHHYIGGATLWLTLLGLCAWPRGHRHRRIVWLHAALALVFLLYGLGPEGGIQPLLAGLPVLGSFRIPARALVVLGLPVAVLAALGVDALTGSPARRRRILAIGSALAAGALLTALDGTAQRLALFAAALVGAALLEKSSGAREMETSAATPAPASTTFTHAVRLAGAALLTLALAADTGTAIKPWVTTAPEHEIGGLAPGLELPGDLSDSSRIAELGRDTVTPGIPELARRRLGLETLSGYNSLIPWRFFLYACHASGYSPFAQNIAEAVPLRYERPKLFDLIGVTHILREPGDDGGPWRWQRNLTALPRAYLVPGPTIVPEGRGEKLMRGEMEALGALEDIDPRRQVLLHGTLAAPALEAAGARQGVVLEPFREVPVTTRTANRITLRLRTDRPGILVLGEPFFPGWRARDGDTEVPVLRANVLFRAVALAPGAHSLVFEFAPASWRLGWWISVVAVFVTAGLAVYGGATRTR